MGGFEEDWTGSPKYSSTFSIPSLYDLTSSMLGREILLHGSKKLRLSLLIFVMSGCSRISYFCNDSLFFELCWGRLGFWNSLEKLYPTCWLLLFDGGLSKLYSSLFLTPTDTVYRFRESDEVFFLVRYYPISFWTSCYIFFCPLWTSLSRWLMSNSWSSSSPEILYWTILSAMT